MSVGAGSREPKLKFFVQGARDRWEVWRACVFSRGAQREEAGRGEWALAEDDRVADDAQTESRYGSGWW